MVPAPGRLAVEEPADTDWGDESSGRILHGGQRYPVDGLVPPFRDKRGGHVVVSSLGTHRQPGVATTGQINDSCFIGHE